MDIFNTVIWWVNIAMIIIIGMTFSFQFLFQFLFVLKPRKYKEADTYHDFTVIIRARNEEDVIGDCVDSARSCDYPEDKKHVIVFCHNCTDNTASIAREHGARVIEINDTDPKHMKLSYNIYYGMQELKKDGEGKYDYFLFIDADEQLDVNYIKECNKAACEGVMLGRTYENVKNFTDTMVSCMSGIWYIRDNRFACRGRSALKTSCVMDGGAGMCKAELALDWDSLSSSEDLEFTINRLLKDSIKVEFIDEAIVYADQPTTIKDIYNRNTRMGNGLNKLFWTKGIECLKRFFKTLFRRDVSFSLKMSYLDQYFNLAIIPSTFLAVVWFASYYIYCLVYTGLGYDYVVKGLGQYSFSWFLIFVIAVGLSCLLLPFFIQPLLSVVCERKKLILKRKWIAVFSVILYPTFILIQAASIFQGILSKPKWKKITRSKTKVDLCQNKNNDKEV